MDFQSFESHRPQVQINTREKDLAFLAILERFTDFQKNALKQLKKVDPVDSQDSHMIDLYFFIICELLVHCDKSILSTLKQRVFSFCYPEKVQKQKNLEWQFKQVQTKFKSLYSQFDEIQFEFGASETEETK